jgi:O-antigen/teichoic acid export membrane protein
MTTYARHHDVTSLAKGGTLNFVGSVVGALLTMALIVVVTRSLGASVAGAYLEVVALYNIVIICGTLGADTGLVRFTSGALALEGRVGLGRLLTVALVPVAALGILATIVGLVLAPEIGRALGGANESETVRSMVIVLAFFVPAGSLALAILGATRGFGTMLPTVAAERVGRPAVQLTAIAALTAAGVGVGWLALGWGVGVMLSLVAAAAWLGRLWSISGRPSTAQVADWRPLTRRFWAFSLPRAFASAFRVGVLWLDVILVGALISPTAAAVYTVATRLLQAGFIAVDAIGQTVEPLFSRLLAKEEMAGANALYQVATSWLVAITWPLFLAVWIFAPTLLGLFGQEFVGASSVITILATSALVGSGLGPIDVLLVMSGRTMWGLWNSMAALFLNVVLNIVLIPRLGLDGAAIAWAVSRVASNLLPLVEMRTVYRFHPFGRGWRVSASASVLVFGLGGLLARFTLGTSVAAFLIYAVGATLLYGFILWKFRRPLDIAAFSALVGDRFRKTESTTA